MIESATPAARRHAAQRSLATLVAAVVVYYLLPLGALSSSPLAAVATVLGLLVGVVVLTWLAVVQIRLQLSAGDDWSVRAQSLLGVVYLVVVVFAAGYYGLQQAASGQFVGLETKTDSLYFTMSTLATVGFGDVHATGQVARALVTVQIGFDLVVVAALASTFTHRLRRRAEAAAAEAEAARATEAEAARAAAPAPRPDDRPPDEAPPDAGSPA